MLDRIHLQILLAVQRQGTLTGAASSMHLTQSALSHGIKKLEQQLGTPIWQKEGRKLRLTQAGECILQLAHRVIPQFEHTEHLVKDIAEGKRGALRIGMECHPCYRWLLTIISPFLKNWPDVDLDVKQRFQFGGMRALFSHDIDVLVTPDPLQLPGVVFTPVFDYELVLAVSAGHAFCQQPWLEPQWLREQRLITYPVERDRLDIFSQFLTPANVRPKQHKNIETTDIMLQMVASDRGVAALPAWLVKEYASTLDIKACRLGQSGIHKQLFVGVREQDSDIDYIADFILRAAAHQVD